MDDRQKPEDFLEYIRQQEALNARRGRLKIFFGYAAGVGKTYAMLLEAQELLKDGVNVFTGYIEPHDRPETTLLTENLPKIPEKIYLYRNIEVKEFDVDQALKINPSVILVDELAHTNVEGSRNLKRYQDIEELLQAGIDVYTTVNVQHIESLKDVMEKRTGVQVRESVPDYIFENADKIELIDLDSEELIERLKMGKIYPKHRIKQATANFFTEDNLRFLREYAMRELADRIEVVPSKIKHVKESAKIKILVCMSTSPSSDKAIRWGARIAEAFHGTWNVVYVQRNKEEKLSAKEASILQKNIELTEKLGGRAVILKGSDVAQTIADYANIIGATNIVIGKSQHSSGFRYLFEEDFEDRLIRLIGNTEIHILSDNDLPRRYWEKQQLKTWAKNWQWTTADFGKMSIILVLTLFCSYVVNHLLQTTESLPLILILGVVLIARMTNGYLYGLLASFIGIVTLDFFFIPPIYQLKIHDPNFPAVLVIMLVISVIVSAMTAHTKNHATIAVEREQRLEVLYDINKKLLETRGLEKIVAVVSDYLGNLFNKSVVFYVKKPDGFIYSDSYILPNKTLSDLETKEEAAVVDWVFANNKVAGAGTNTFRGAQAYYKPINFENEVLGVIGFVGKERGLNQENISLLRIIITLVAMALQRQNLSDEQRDILLESEREKLRGNLLRGISHDLRTPLTSILGASSAILENDKFDEKTKKQLVGSIKNDAQWLIRLVENLLSVTKINAGRLSLTKTEELAEEVVTDAVSRTSQRFPTRKFVTKGYEQPIFIPMDGTLIAQVLINLLENAIKHSPEDAAIEVEIKPRENRVEFIVVDHGEGISEAEFPYLFKELKPDQKRSADSKRGMGIGLSICKSIVVAHGGEMNACNRSTGGASFSFWLPIEKEEQVNG